MTNHNNFRCSKFRAVFISSMSFPFISHCALEAEGKGVSMVVYAQMEEVGIEFLVVDGYRPCLFNLYIYQTLPLATLRQSRKSMTAF